jgi:phage regulator Rha-like protein
MSVKSKLWQMFFIEPRKHAYAYISDQGVVTYILHKNKRESILVYVGICELY